MELEVKAQQGKYCSLAERQAKHAERIALRAGIPVGEPLPHLTGAQLNEYHNLLHPVLGLSEEDAQRVYRERKETYTHGPEVERVRVAHNILTVIEAARSLVHKPSLQEVTVFEAVEH